MPQSLAIEVPTPHGPGALVLVGLDGQEGLSSLSQFQLTLKSKRPDIAAPQMLGQNATVRVDGTPGPPRYINGYITRWSGVTELRDSVDGARQTKAYRYEATLSCWLWFLTRQSNSRIFQHKTVPEIVEAVFKAHGALASFKPQLSASYRRWDYCVQYRESDFNFVSRLMEQEGIYYFVRHANGRHELVLVDDSASHQPAAGYELLHFDEEDRAGTDQIRRWQSTHEIQTGRYVARDYQPLTPRMLIEGQSDRPVSHPYGNYSAFDYPSEVDTPEEARTTARLRLEELHSRYQVFTGGGSVRGLHPGCSFTLARHPVPAFNDQLLVVAASYHSRNTADSSSSGSAFSFDCELQAIYLKQPFRPPRQTPKPVVQGPQTAVVVGPQGAEIHTDPDGHGRIKVQFRWDRYGTADADSSCWMRVVQPWAGNGYGAWALPRVGQEVVVEFLEGDPDRPLVTGSVYNAENRPPYKLPDEHTRWGIKSRSSAGGGASNFNELRFDDKKGSEEVYLHAEKDQTLYTKNQRTEFVGGESHLKVERDQLQHLGADRHLDLSGDDMARVGGGVHLTIAQDWQAKTGAKLAAQAGTEIHLKAGMNVVIEAGTQLTLKVGGNFVDINPAGVFIKGTMVMINSGGAAGSGSGASPKAPKNAAKAHGSQGGTDKPISQKAAALQAARAASTPFCEICNG